jgi:hypothetical protein
MQVPSNMKGMVEAAGWDHEKDDGRRSGSQGEKKHWWDEVD